MQTQTVQTQTINISETANQLLQELADLEKISTEAVLERALENYRRELFWKQTNEAFAALKADPEAWAEEIAERNLWEQTIADGVEQE
jgi:hypothetical protein